MTAYKDRKTVSFEATKTFEHDRVRESKITLSTHTGTHVDAPAHFLPGGETIDATPLEMLMGNCLVLDFTSVKEKITRADLEIYDIDDEDIILLKTKNSSLSPTAPFETDFVYLEESGAQYLIEAGAKAVGIDYLGIERQQADHATHKALMLAALPIIEGLRLGHVHEGEYSIACLPLQTVGLEAAPARVILIED